MRYCCNSCGSVVELSTVLHNVLEDICQIFGNEVDCVIDHTRPNYFRLYSRSGIFSEKILDYVAHLKPPLHYLVRMDDDLDTIFLAIYDWIAPEEGGEKSGF